MILLAINPSRKTGFFFIRIIAISNLIYTCVTAGLVLYFYQELTIICILYFVLEILVLCVLVSFEFKVAKILTTKDRLT